MVNYLRQAWSTSENRTCRLIQLDRKIYRYQSKRVDQTPLRERIREIAFTRVRYGYKRIYVLLRREGWKINHKSQRPHSTLNYEAPSVFAQEIQASHQ